MKKNTYTILLVSLLPLAGLAQTVNQGIITVLPQTDISTVESFVNHQQAAVKNDGNFYFYADFNNDGLYSFDQTRKSSYAVFQPYEAQRNPQHLTGEAPSEFYDVLFNNPSGARAFELTNDMSISGTANFTDGVVQIDSIYGAMVFQKGSTSINMSDNSHVDGQVEKIGNDAFTYPIGDEHMYRLAKISAPKNLRDSFLGKYYLQNSDPIHSHFNRTGVLELIDNKEYWTIEQDAQTSSDIILTLSWDERTTPSELLTNPEKELRIVRWDAREQLWVDQGGIVDMQSKTVTSPTTVDGYGIFTLAKAKEHLILDGDVVIYNAVTPNGDGYNDHFVIDHIERFPNNKVEIFNRWGVKVYSATSYNNTDTNFTGYSDGRITINKGELLPTGTYYYIVEYEYSDASGSRTIKKAGFLHLETE